MACSQSKTTPIGSKILEKELTKQYEMMNGFHEPIHRDGIHLSWKGDLVNTEELWLEVTLQIRDAKVSNCSHIHEWIDMDSKVVDLMNYQQLVGSSSFSHTHSNIAYPITFWASSWAIFNKFISKQLNIFFNMSKTLLSLGYIFFMKTMSTSKDGQIGHETLTIVDPR
jgi:hypothetical protein